MALNHLLLKDCIKVITALFHQPTKWRFLYLSMAVFLLSSKNTLAFSEPYLNPVIAFDAGINTSFDVGTSQNFPAADTNSQFYDYTANTSRQSVGLAGIFLGYEWEWRTPWLIQTGISYHQSSAFTAKGTLTQGLDTASQDTYQYQYDILVRQLLIESKWLYTIQQYHPYVLAGAGVAFNTASDYTTTVPTESNLTAEYQNYTTTSFSYALGFGVDTDLSDHVRLGLGYRFTDLGKAQLGNATYNGIPVAGGFGQTHLYAQQLLAQLTYIF